MNMRPIGNSNLKVSALGFGAWAIGGEWIFDKNQAGWGKVDDAESIRAIHAALDAGLNLIDTAANYGTGHSEEIVGQAVKGRRDQVVIATKFGFDVDEAAKKVAYHASADAIINNLPAECERSLRHLDTDVIDIYQFHMWDFPAERIPELLDALEKLVTQGKIRTYGWSTDDVALSRLFAKGEHCAVIQHRGNVLDAAEEMFAFTQQEAELTSLIRSPLLMGFLSDKYGKEATFVETDVRSGFEREQIHRFIETRDKIREILTSNGRSVVQGALAWLLAQGPRVVPIPGIRTPAQAIENAGALEFGPLTPAQLTEIEILLRRDEKMAA